MNVNRVQNNNSQSFGMALKFTPDGVNRIAEALHDVPLSQYSQRIKNFTEGIADPIHKLKTNVEVDGESITIYRNAEGVDKWFKFSDLPKLRELPEEYAIRRSEKELACLNYELMGISPIEKSLIIAREIGKDLDAKADAKKLLLDKYV